VPSAPTTTARLTRQLRFDDDTVAPHAIQFTMAAMDTDLLETEPFESAAARLPLCLPRYEDQVPVGFGLGNEEPSEYLEFENHNPTALILYKPIIRAFSRIGDKFNLTRLPM
jgi:hypothetical protein